MLGFFKRHRKYYICKRKILGEDKVNVTVNIIWSNLYRYRLDSIYPEFLVKEKIYHRSMTVPSLLFLKEKYCRSCKLTFRIAFAGSPQSSSLPLCLSTKAERESRDRDSSNSAILMPALKRSRVGYPLTEWREQRPRSSVQSTLAILTPLWLEYLFANSSQVGAMLRQCPHQGA